MQLQLLDRVAGCRAHAARLAECWQRHQVLEQQLQDIAALGGPDERMSLSDLIDNVTAYFPLLPSE